MRRYILSLMLVAAVLIGGGLAISGNFGLEVITRGYYVPTLSPDPDTAQTQALILVGGVAAVAFLTIGMGVGLAIALNQYLKMQAATSAAARLSTKAEAPAKPAPKGGGETPSIPLSDTRSLVIFWVIAVAVIAAFLTPRYWGRPLGFIPNLLVTRPTPSGPSTSGAESAPAPSGGSETDALQAGFAALPPGDAAAGQSAFSGAGCVACHSLAPDVKIVGPSLAGVGTRAASQKSGYSAEVYLYESIIAPNAYLVEGFQPDLMPKTFQDTLPPQNLANVIAFLLAQK